MGNADSTQAWFATAIARFPDEGALLRRHAVADPEFRELCRDYALAVECLARFERMPDADARPEVADYRTIVAELEIEIGAYLTELRGEG